MKGRKTTNWRLAALALASLLLLMPALLGSSLGLPQPSDGNQTERINDTTVAAANQSAIAKSSALNNSDASSSNSSARDVGDVAELYSPSGIITSGRPTYVWSEVPGTEFYCLVVTDAMDDEVLNSCYDANGLLADEDSRLSVTPSITLAGGSYSWQIRTWSCDFDEWSEPMEFVVCTSKTLPGKPNLVSPKNTIGTTDPIFRWNSVSSATMYRLKVASLSDLSNPIITDWQDASEVTSDNGCSMVLGESLDYLSYRWWVQAANCAGEGPWSNYMSFRVTSDVPAKVTTISPKGLISTRTPKFVWSALSTATQYHLQVLDGDDLVLMEEWYTAEDITVGNKCSVPCPSILPDDTADFYWQVQAINDNGEGDWSTLKYFETVCSEPKGRSLGNATVNETLNLTLTNETINQTLLVEAPDKSSIRASANNTAQSQSLNETLVNETLTNETLVNETLTNETLTNETLVNETIVNETLTNETLVNETLTNETLVNETLTNETLTNETIVNETLVNETITNETLINETLINETLINETLINETLINETLTNETLINESIKAV